MLSVIRKIVSRLPEGQQARLTRLRRPRLAYLLLQRTTPISRSHGFDRGTPVDRHYIEKFLQENGRYIRGVCLEVTDGTYTRRYGSDISRVDVLDINPANPQANVVGDLRRLQSVEDETYDCFILTQVLQYIDDVDAAVREVARILKPGGSVLVTLPSLHAMEAGHPHYWKFSTHSAKYLFGKYFPADHLEVRGWGNVATGVAAWVGMAREDLPRRHLEEHDPRYPCTITVRATKPARAVAASPAQGELIGRSVSVALGALGACTGVAAF
ncbi:MAG TPA: class I SAM-dependent methyltransferase [Tepidisphaeraceae bacterium]|nr:class I SAM-dependent methyltransferase [Tepidisphaeraceae bacterium]